MRENRTCGSEGGEAQSLPYPYPKPRALGMPARKPARVRPRWRVVSTVKVRAGIIP